MPTRGPRLALLIAASPTISGLAAVPATRRADARLGTGCMVSPMRTYSAPDVRAITIGASQLTLGFQKRQDCATGDGDYRQDASRDERK